MAFCKNCGAEIPEGNTLCDNCGKDVNTISEPTDEKTENNEAASTSDEESHTKEINSENDVTKDLYEISNDFKEDSMEKDETYNNDFKVSEEKGINESKNSQENVFDKIEMAPEKGKSSFIKLLPLGIVAIIIIGIIAVVSVNIKNSPEKIFEKASASESFNKYIIQGNYNVTGYSVADILNDDGKEEIIFYVENKDDNMLNKSLFVGMEDSVTGEYRIGRIQQIGGEFLESIEILENTNNERGICVCTKSVSEVKQEYIDAIKETIQMNDEEYIRQIFETICGREEYQVLNMIDYNIESYSKSIVEANGYDYDFIVYFIPSEVSTKLKKDSEDGFSYQYIKTDEFMKNNTNSMGSVNPEDYEISEEEYNSYVDGFRSNKKALEIFEVSEETKNKWEESASSNDEENGSDAEEGAEDNSSGEEA